MQPRCRFAALQPALAVRRATLGQCRSAATLAGGSRLVTRHDCRRPLQAARSVDRRLCDLHARPERPRDQLERRRRADQGLPDRRDHRPAFLDLLHRGGPRGRNARRRCSKPPGARANIEGEGWRVRKDGIALLGERGHRRDQRRQGRADRLRQDHPRHDREARGAAGAARGRAAASGSSSRASPTMRSTCSTPTAG